MLAARILDGLDPQTLKRSEESSFGELVQSSPAYQRHAGEYRERQQQWIREGVKTP